MVRFQYSNAEIILFVNREKTLNLNGALRHPEKKMAHFDSRIQIGMAAVVLKYPLGMEDHPELSM